MTSAAWTLAGFEQRLDRWVFDEEPGEALRTLVTTWVLSRFDDPYDGVVREAGFANLWYGAIPGSLHETDHVVVCAYWIYERTRTVMCESFASLSLPVWSRKACLLADSKIDISAISWDITGGTR